MNWPQQGPPGGQQYPPPAPGYQYPPPPPLPADARIKKGVRRGEAFSDPQDARRAAAYAEVVLKNGSDLTSPKILVAILVGLLVTVALQYSFNDLWVLIAPLGAFFGLIVFVVTFSLRRPRVEQSLVANRRIAGGGH